MPGPSDQYGFLAFRFKEAYIFTYCIVTFQKSLSTPPLGAFIFWVFFFRCFFCCMFTKYIEIVSITKRANISDSFTTN